MSASAGAGERPVAFRMLGPIELVDDTGNPVAIEGRRTRSLLAILLVHRNRPVPADTLIDGLWGDEPPAQAKATLHSYISKLRSSIAAAVGPAGGERIVRRSAGYQLVALDGEVDADRLERTLALAEVAIREHRFAAASASLRQGLALIRGPLLGESRDEPYARPELARLEGIRLRALERRVDAELALGRHAALVGELEGLVAEHGLCERFQEQLMLALYRSGRQADALRVYQTAHRLLAEELGLLPGPGLRGLEAAILAQDEALELPLSAAVPSPQATGELPFVGRHRELGVLQAAWRRAVAGERQFVVIEADPGMGATRLGAEIANVARGDGAEVLVGRAAGDALIPYFPFVEALGNLPAEELQLAVGAGAGYLADLLPGFRHHDGVRPGQPGAQASSHRYLMFEAVVTLLNGVGAAAGAVLILDDVHGADPSTLQLVEHLARHRSKGRLLIVATADASQSPGTGAGALLSGLVADGLATRLRPEGLSVEEVGDLLRAAAGRSDGILPGLAAAVHGLTMGMPLFVSELGKGLAELDARAVQEASDLPISERIEAVLERRVNQVPPGVVAMLSTAAVIGMAFDAEVVAALSQQAVRALAGPLDTAIASGLIVEDGVAGRYRFAHPLLHRALQQRVGPSSRGEMHGELANILAGPDAPHDTTPGELAHHFKRAALHHARQAVTYAVRAGDHAMSVLAFEDAADFYSSALETLRTFGAQDLPLEGRIFLALGRAHHAAYQRIAAVAAFRQAAQLALRAADADALAAATWGLMVTTEFSHADIEVVGLLRQALATCDDVDGPLRARLTAGLARVLPAGDSEASALSADAVAMARRIQEPETLASVLAAAVLITWSPDNLAWRWATTNEVIALAGNLDWVELAMEARNWRAAMYEEQGDLVASDTDLATVDGWAAGSRRPFFCGLIAMRRAARALLQGRYEEAEDQAHQMVAVGGESPDFIAGFGAQLLLLRRDQGRLAELDELIDQWVSTSPNVPAWRVARALVDAAVGRPRQARVELDELARDGVAALPRDWLWLVPATLLADVCADLAVGEHQVGASAQSLVRALTPFEDRVAVLGHGIAATGAVSGPLGRLEAQLGLGPSAERHFRHALALNEKIGAFPALARAKAGYAEMLARRDGPDDNLRAAKLLDEARTIAVRLGMNVRFYDPVR